MKDTFSERLKLVLKNSDITQADLANKSGLPQMTINHYCSGRREPTIENLTAILDALWFVDARWLVTGKVGK